MKKKNIQDFFQYLDIIYKEIYIIFILEKKKRFLRFIIDK
jgi:hypothetical protein